MPSGPTRSRAEGRGDVRTYIIKIRRTIEMEREVVVQVEENAEREAWLKRHPEAYQDEAHDAALGKAKTLTGWESSGQPEYTAVSIQAVESAPNVDIVV